MNWAGLALAFIQLAASILEWSKHRNAVAEAQQLETARQALRLLELTEQGKKLRAHLAMMNDEEAQALWLEMVNAK